MLHHYGDIVDRIDETPRWWDEHGVPRFCCFGPDHLANIYAREAVLLRIECQGCGTPFLVALSRSDLGRYGWTPDADYETTGKGTFGPLPGATLAERIEADEIHYGDPPNTGCCPAGPTMNSIPREVVEYWRAERACVWERRPELERRIACDWADPEPLNVDAGRSGDDARPADQSPGRD